MVKEAFKQVDVLPSKNQVLNDVTSKSCEQRLITKGHVAMHTNLILLFKPALYSSTLVIKLFIKVV